MTTTAPLLISIEETSRRLGVHHRTVKRLIDQGELRTVDTEHRRYVYAVDVAQYATPKGATA